MRFAEEIANISATLQRHWTSIPGDCPELHARAIPDTETAQLLSTTERTFQETQDAIRQLNEELQNHLQSPVSHTRSKRYAHLPAAAAGAGLLTIGAQLTSGCVAGVLGPCPNEHNIASNRRKIQATIANLEASNQHWAQVQSDTNNQLFVLNQNVDQLAANQRTIQQNQQDNYGPPPKTRLPDSPTVCIQCRSVQSIFFMRSQLNLLRNTLTSRLHLVHASLQAFRAALWSYQATILDAIPGLAVGLLAHVASFPPTLLLQILDSIHSQQARSNAHLTLALTLDNLLQYYETPLVTRAESTPEGLLLTVGIPLTSREMILDIFRAITLPMPLNSSSDPAAALMWQPETSLIAISHNHKEHALLPREQLDECKGPEAAAICQHGFPTTRKRDSCLANLFFHTAAEAAQVCETHDNQASKSRNRQKPGFWHDGL